jgi:hypothetical protein
MKVLAQREAKGHAETGGLSTHVRVGNAGQIRRGPDPGFYGLHACATTDCPHAFREILEWGRLKVEVLASPEEGKGGDCGCRPG